MNYRDDRDALRAEVDTLHQELDAARADQTRLQRIEERLAAAKAEMQSLEAELDHAKGRAPRSTRGVILPLVVAVLAVLAGAGAFLTIGRPAPPPVAGFPTATAIPAPEPPAPPRSITTPEPIPPTETREAQAAWSATVTRSTDPTIHAGAACEVGAKVVPDKSGMHVTGVTVTCGGKVIYDQAGRLNGTSMLDSDAQQRAGTKAGTWVYELIFSDVGARSATRSQAQLDSTKKIGKVWSENLPETRVDLAIKSGSAPVSVAVVDAK